jgi:hypothetical protein
MSKRSGYIMKMASGEYMHVACMVTSDNKPFYIYLPGVYDYACLTLLPRKAIEAILVDRKAAGLELPAEVVHITIVETHDYKPEKLHEFLGDTGHPLIIGH